MNEYGYTLDYADECSAWKMNIHGPARKRCGNAPYHDIEGILYLCHKHYRMIEDHNRAQSHQMSNQRTERLEQELRDIEEEKRTKANADHFIAVKSAKKVHVKASQVVYFIRCERFVKIGISIDADKRLKTIQTSGGSMFPRGMDVAQSVLMGTVPGGRAHETALHQQFSHLRHTGEWFEATPELIDYIKEAITS